jgi:hypothetical protein
MLATLGKLAEPPLIAPALDLFPQSVKKLFVGLKHVMPPSSYSECALRFAINACAPKK